MSQIKDSVGISQAGSTNAVLASRSRFMSDSWICWKPRMLEPSKPVPSSQMPPSNSEVGIEKRCHVPGRSVNFRSTISMLCWAIKWLTFFGVGIEILLLSQRYGEYDAELTLL